MLNTTEGSRKKMLVLVKQALVGCGIGATSLIGLMSNANLAFTQAAPEDSGLAGILAPEPPEGLYEEDFAVLDGQWAEWSAAAAQDVARLYSEEPLSPADTKLALEAIASRLRVMEKALADNRYASIYKPLATLHGRLKRRYDVAQAALATLDVDPAAAKQQRLDGAVKDVLAAQGRLATFLEGYNGGSAWLGYLGAGDLTKALDGKTAAGDVLAVLGPIADKIAARGQLASDEQKTFLGHQPFLDLAAEIDGYRAIAAAETDPNYKSALREQLAQLVETLERYELSAKSDDAKAAREAFAAVSATSPDGGKLIGDALRAHYMNYNVHVVASENLLQKLVREDRTEQGEVVDFILGANVYGHQTTNSTVGIDLKDSRRGIRFDITVNGVVHSNTSGTTDQAVVYTQGTHYLNMAKEVNFDGNRFSTQPARISVNANNNTFDASTDLDGIPLLSGIGRNIALNEAAKKRGQSEAIAASRVRDKALPKFNEEVQKEFDKATSELNDSFYTGLRKGNLYPSAMSYRSSDTHIVADTRTMEGAELGGSRPNPLPVSAQGAVVEVHESAANNMFDRLGIAGKTLTDKEFAQHVADYFETVFGQKIKALEENEKEYESDGTALIFAEQDPVRLQFENGQVILTIRAGLKREGDDDIPTQEITVPLSFTMQDGKIVAEAGDVGVSPVERPDSIQVQIARAGVIRKKLSDALPRREIDPQFDLTDDDGDIVLLNVTAVDFINGWLRVVIE